MSTMDKMSDLCPKCFGPPVPGKKPEEPDYIVCMDGNIQHRRHKASSNEVIALKTPSLFVEQEDVQAMPISVNNTRIGDAKAQESLDHCTNQHTAADDLQGSHTRKACDNTGIFGMACRHDQILRLINIERSGESYHCNILQGLLPYDHG
ncbi:uncharacterized protein PGTG_22533 [Puccinia graminis f. sp. tritici CRL 75-36-700-3]|uniref:Uncharacterized protein n=1 Tax=Puccinia graminis f. sp. tritici (strain CRL 75-36-700-3 / race SCCL) TaxID=418459 RepID=H6QUW2_PUCGT|nr:uncharacterized protein PGTG_22533 [Puccinia graminis f. sp. tritici CRL 75-36-700-3]EHS64870.1 hypothetical protein PGTG_22533 [Puccinia graminis f. sp. tritici CRL 75-36-700-3]